MVEPFPPDALRYPCLLVGEQNRQQFPLCGVEMVVERRLGDIVHGRDLAPAALARGLEVTAGVGGSQDLVLALGEPSLDRREELEPRPRPPIPVLATASVAPG